VRAGAGGVEPGACPQPRDARLPPQGACLHPRGARQQPRGARLRLPPFRWSRDLLSAGCDLKGQPSRGRKRYIVGVVVPDDFFVPRVGPASGPIFRGRFRRRAFVKSGSGTEFSRNRAAGAYFQKTASVVGTISARAQIGPTASPVGAEIDTQPGTYET